MHHNLDGSILASTLSSGNFNQAEQDEIVREVAQQDPTAFYARDTYRVLGDDPQLGLDEAVISDGVQQAYMDGALGTKDLLHIANGGPSTYNEGTRVDSRRFMNILMQGDGATLQGSAAEALAKGLWANNGNSGSDRAAAALYYNSAYYGPGAVQNGPNSSVPPLQDTFQALVQFSNSLPNTGSYPQGEGPIGTQLNNQTLEAQTNLLVQYGQQIVDYFAGTRQDDQGSPLVLAQFMSETAFDPAVKDMRLSTGPDAGKTIGSVVTGTLSNVTGTLLNQAVQAQKLPASQDQWLASHYPMEELGTLSGAVTSGAVLALNRYNSQTQARKQSEDSFVNTVTELYQAWLGKYLPFDGKVANTVSGLVTQLTNWVTHSADKQPLKPDIQRILQSQDSLPAKIEALRTTPGWQDPDSLQEFQGTFNTTINMLVGPLAQAEKSGG